MKNETTYISRINLEKRISKEQEIPVVRTISYSQYSKYFKCPKSWALDKIDKIREASESVDLVFGQAMHTVIQFWLKTIYTNSVKQSNEIDLNKMLLTEMQKEYLKRKTKMNGEHFTTPETLSSYYQDGVEILNYLKKKRTSYFSTKKTELIAIELPLSMQVHEDYPTIRLTGYIDLVFYNSVSNRYTVIDIKTSGRGWNNYKKKDIFTTDQVLLYKKFLANILNIDVSQIDVTFFILKRKLNEDVLWPQKRIQEFSPSSGKVSMNRVTKNLHKFVEECFNFDGSYKTNKVYPATAGLNYRNCTFCIYDEMPGVCPKEKRICSSYE